MVSVLCWSRQSLVRFPGWNMLAAIMLEACIFPDAVRSREPVLTALGPSLPSPTSSSPLSLTSHTCFLNSLLPYPSPSLSLNLHRLVSLIKIWREIIIGILSGWNGEEDKVVPLNNTVLLVFSSSLISQAKYNNSWLSNLHFLCLKKFTFYWF